MNSIDFKTTYYKNKEETRFYKLLHKEIILISIVENEVIVNHFRTNRKECESIKLYAFTLCSDSIEVTKKDFDTLTRVAMLSKLVN